MTYRRFLHIQLTSVTRPKPAPRSPLATDATSDVQVGMVSVSPNESGEGVIRLVTMERRPSKYDVSVDETTGAFTITTNEGAKDDSASQ